MTIKTLLTASVVVLVTTASGFAMGCQGGDHESASMSCAQGTVYDADSNSCKVVSG